MDFFDHQWQTYRRVVDNDWMEHRGLTAACAAALETWMSRHPDRRGHARLLDLGCGDLAHMAPVFRALPLHAYVGVDVTEQTLTLARSALNPAPFMTEFHHADVRAFVKPQGETFDLVHASLVLHHLSDTEKIGFLSVLRQRLHPNGAFLWADVFREAGESRLAYVARYASRIRQGWREISDTARESIVSHMSTYDFPADRADIVVAAKNAGWRWRWLWRGSYQAEAVALLTPIPLP